MRSVLVPKPLYHEILALAPGQSLVKSLHFHVPTQGEYEMFCGGHRPLKCKVVPTQTRGQRRGKKRTFVEVQLTRK